MMPPRLLLLLVGFAAAIAAQPPASAVQRLDSPAALDSEAPQLTTSADGGVVLSWVESVVGQGIVKFAERTPAGWSASRPVVADPHLVVNWADVPAVRRLPDGTLVATWNLENGDNPEAYDLWLARSTDAGRTWSRAIRPHDDRTVTQHGFATVFPRPGGGFGLAWLDGRKTDPESGEGDMALYASMYGANGAPAGAPAAIDSRVCDCCPLAAASTSDGPILAFRDRSSAEVRDIYVARLSAGRWAAPVRVHADNWTIEACPVNGPAIAARGQDVAVGWFTAATGEGRSYAAFSRDGGRTFGEPIRVDEASSLGRMQIAWLPGDAAAVSWTEFAGGRSSLEVRRIGRDGRRGPAVVLAARIGTQYPRLAADGDGVVAAWVEDTRGSTRIATARVALGLQ